MLPYAEKKRNITTGGKGIISKKSKKALHHSLSSTKQPLCKRCPYSELFWSVFSRIKTEYREIIRISSYSVLMRNPEYGHFSRGEQG